MKILEEEKCLPTTQLQLKLGLTPFKYHIFILKMSREKLIIKHPCGFKNTFKAERYLKTNSQHQPQIFQSKNLSYQELTTEQSSEASNYQDYQDYQQIQQKNQ